MIDYGDIPVGATIPFRFRTYDSDGANVTISGFAVGDVECYKADSMTQRTSDNGITLSDTDGIDLDSRTGLHGFSIDTSDNSDSGFWAAGSWYTIDVGDITCDGQTITVSFRFRLVAAESVTGTPKSDVGAVSGDATAADTLELFAEALDQSTGQLDSGSLANNTITANSIASDAITAAKIASDAITAAKIASDAITSAKIADGAITAAKIANNAIDAATFAADVDAEVRGWLGLATNNLDTQLTAITGRLPSTTAATNMTTVFDTDFATNYSTTYDMWQVNAKKFGDGDITENIGDNFREFFDNDGGASSLYLDLLATASAVSAVAAVTVKLDDTLEDQGGGTYGFTEAALQEAPTGGSAPTVEEIRTEIDDNSTKLAAILEDTGTTLPALFPASFSTLTISGGLMLARLADNVNHAGSGAGLTLQSITIANGSGPGITILSTSSHGISIASTAGDGIRTVSAAGGVGLKIDSLDAGGTLSGILADTGTDGVVVASGSKTGYSLASSHDVYHAEINLCIDDANSQDEYGARWFKNGVRVTSGITSPLIQVVKRSDGTDLIAETAMTQVGSTGAYKYDATTTARTTAGEAVLVSVKATIDGSQRIFDRWISRDSTS